MFWNKRTACTCPWKSNYTDGVEDKSKPAAYQKGWGCQPWRGIGKSDYPVGDGDGQLNGGDDDVKGKNPIENDDKLKKELPFV
jgi:hypothetical protein